MGEAKRRRDRDPTYGNIRRLYQGKIAEIRQVVAQQDRMAQTCKAVWDERVTNPDGCPYPADLVQRSLKTLAAIYFPFLDWDNPETWRRYVQPLLTREDWPTWEQINQAIEEQIQTEEHD